MTAQVLWRPEKVYRIGDPKGSYPIFDGTGAGFYPGRWNLSSSPVIYASSEYGTAMLEKLVHGSGMMPPNQHYIEIILSAGLSYEWLNPSQLPGWDAKDEAVPQTYGDLWFTERRSLLLYVPSIVARVSTNVLINPTHPDFSKITHGHHVPVHWDNRLFATIPPEP